MCDRNVEEVRATIVNSTSNAAKGTVNTERTSFTIAANDQIIDADPFSVGELMYDTGDLARVDHDGYIRITGRSKDVIIRGGENIPVVEIEAVLYQHPAVAQVAIVAMRILGLYYYRRRKLLRWHRKRPRWGVNWGL